jgi:hypothetical protein
LTTFAVVLESEVVEFRVEDVDVVVDDEVLLVLSCATNEHTTQWNSKAPKPKHERQTTNATSSKRRGSFTDPSGGDLLKMKM